MRQDQIVILCMGISFLAIGLGLTLNEGFARWGLNRGRARIWISLLGERRAVKVTRYCFGPFTVLIGIACFVMLLVPNASR